MIVVKIATMQKDTKSKLNRISDESEEDVEKDS